MSDINQYQPAGYAHGDDQERVAALDAAVRFTASRRGPPFDTEHDGAEWWIPAYDCACRALEAAIVDALVGDQDD